MPEVKPTIDPIYVGNEAISHLLAYTDQHSLNRFTIISDTHTYRALGEQVEKALKARNYDVKSVVLSGAEVIADERYVVQALLHAQLGPTTFIAVGSGTLTDITRFSSHRSGRAFISVPTAPSVDGFTSVGAPIVLSGVKTTIISQAPLAVFANIETLRSAPHRLIAAGFGDMIGKITSIADWRVGALLWEEPFDQSIYNRSKAAIDTCVQSAGEIGQDIEAGVRNLMDTLIESGLCMLDFGSSRPASGAEHHASHYWEMILLQEGRPAALHGAKVGFALIHVAAQYARLRALSRAEMMDRLEGATLPDRDAEIATIHAGYGPLAEDVIKEHAPFLDMSAAQFEQVKQRVASNWDALQEIAASVPPPEQIIEYLRQAGAVTDAEALGLSNEEVARGFQYGHYLRNRFTIMKLSRILDLPLT